MIGYDLPLPAAGLARAGFVPDDSLDRSGAWPARFGVGPENESARLQGQLPSQSGWWFSILFGNVGKNA